MAVPLKKVDELTDRLIAVGGAFMAHLALKEAALLSDADPDVWALRGRANEELKEHETASQCYWRAYELSNHPWHFGAYAYSLIRLGKETKSEAIAKKGVEILLDFVERKLPIPPAYTTLVSYYWGEGDGSAVFRILNAGLSVPEIQAHHAGFLFLMSFTYFACGIEERARHYALEALRLAMDKPFKTLTDVPLEGALTVARTSTAWDRNDENRDRFVSLLEKWIAAAREKQEVRNDRAQAIRERNAARRATKGEDVVHTEETAREAISLMAEMAPYRSEANFVGL